MAERAFREEQWNNRYAPHIEPINRFVDRLRTNEDRERWAPYVAPMYGGVRARLLSVLRDPGPMTRDKTGSGFLSMENDDPTAGMIASLFAGAGIDAEDVVPWNAYPWYINRAPKAAELQEGLAPLKRLIELLPSLRVVMLHGGSAHTAWKRFARTHPEVTRTRGLQVIQTYHTSRQAFWTPDPEERERRKRHLVDSFQEAAAVLADEREA